MAVQTSTNQPFSSYLLDVLNHGSLAVMISIGHRTGLFDAMHKLPPSTSGEIARAAGLNERYVREWLGAMTAGSIVECSLSGQNEVFSLAQEKAEYLCRFAAENNIAGIVQYIGLMGVVEDAIVERFRTGEGLPYSAYPRMQTILDEESGHTLPSIVHTAVVPLVPGLEQRLSSGIDAADLGCGSGRVPCMLAERYPNSRFTGIDFCVDAIEAARTRSVDRSLRNIRFLASDLADWREAASFDLITAFDTIHDQGRPDVVLGNIRAALRPDGVFLMQEIAASSHPGTNASLPMAAFLYSISCMHCMPVSLAQNGGMGLGAMWGRERAQELLAAAGFCDVCIERIPADIQNEYYICRRERT